MIGIETIFGRYYKQLDGLVSKPKLRILCMIGTMTMSVQTKTSKTAGASLVSITSHALGPDDVIDFVKKLDEKDGKQSRKSDIGGMLIAFEEEATVYSGVR